MNKIMRLFVSFCAACLFLGILFYFVGHARQSLASDGENTLVVTTLQDVVATDGNCSLREAIEAANTNTTVPDCGTGDVLTDTVTFDVAGSITVTSQLSVTAGGPLVINGGDVITTSGGGTTRVWSVEAGSALSLLNLRIRDGFTDNENGAGLYSDNANLNIVGCEFKENHWKNSDTDQYGGGIYAAGGTVDITDSLFEANGSTNTVGIGGGVALWYSNSRINHSIFSNNSGYWGGGIFSSGSLEITGSDIVGNSGGGIMSNGIYENSVMTMTECTVSGNYLAWDGGGISNSGTMTVINSTIFNNTAEDLYGSGTGGGIRNWKELTIVNSTISGNISVFGGGIGNMPPQYGHTALKIINTSITDNNAQAGGGIYTDFQDPVVITNTIIANNPSGGDCNEYMTWLYDGGHNIDSDNTCGFDPADGSIPGVDPILGPLQDNGGPTLTHALLEGSPAIDAGDDAQCPSTDQRGVPRPLDGDGDGVANCDIGSYEYEGNPPIQKFIFLPMVMK